MATTQSTEECRALHYLNKKFSQKVFFFMVFLIKISKLALPGVMLKYEQGQYTYRKIERKEKFDAVVADCHHSLHLCGERIKMNASKKTHMCIYYFLFPGFY